MLLLVDPVCQIFHRLQPLPLTLFALHLSNYAVPSGPGMQIFSKITPSYTDCMRCSQWTRYALFKNRFHPLTLNLYALHLSNYAAASGPGMTNYSPIRPTACYYCGDLYFVWTFYYDYLELGCFSIKQVYQLKMQVFKLITTTVVTMIHREFMLFNGHTHITGFEKFD